MKRKAMPIYKQSKKNGKLNILTLLNTGKKTGMQSVHSLPILNQ